MYFNKNEIMWFLLLLNVGLSRSLVVDPDVFVASIMHYDDGSSSFFWMRGCFSS